MTDLTFFDVTIPLTRRNDDGTKDRHDVTVRIPSADHLSAESAGVEIGYAIVGNLPVVGDKNAHGWKMFATQEPTVERVRES